jgi:hypothetical protein
MENYRKSVLFLFLGVFLIAFSVSVYAETVEERKAAANYDETLPGPEEDQSVDDAGSVTPVSAEAQPVQATVPPVQAVPVTTAEAQTVPAVSPMAPSSILPVPPSQPVAAAASSTIPVVSPASTPEAGVSQTPGTVQSVAAPGNVPKDMPETQVFTTSNPSGLVEVSGYKYPVFLFAPKDYRTDMTYPMIMIAPAESAKAEKQIEYLTGLAQRRSIFVLAPYVLWPKEGDTPYRLDEWLLTVKRDMVERFPINKKRVYLVGKDLGAHYAAYMGIRYPKEFAAVALLGQAWDGPFSQLIDPHSDPTNQVPFYVALKADGDARAKNQVWFDKLQKKGYPLNLVDYKTDEELNELEFKKSVFEWMETTGQSWAASAAKSQQTWKGKFKKGVKDFFAV